jgi:hypothetical protein
VIRPLILAFPDEITDWTNFLVGTLIYVHLDMVTFADAWA